MHHVFRNGLTDSYTQQIEIESLYIVRGKLFVQVDKYIHLCTKFKAIQNTDLQEKPNCEA